MKSLIWPNSNSSEILWLPLLPASMWNIRSKVKSLSIGQHFHHYKYMGTHFGIQGQITPKSIVWSGRNSSSSENLWVSWLPASLMKIRSNLKALSIGQGQIWAFSALKGKQLLSGESDLAKIRPHPRIYCCPGYLQVWWRSDQNWMHYRQDKVKYKLLSALKGK